MSRLPNETGGKGETSETRGFEVRSSMFSELRTLNFELRVAPFPQQGRSSEADPRFTVPGSEARTPHGKRRVSARRGWAGEKSDFFSILLVVKGNPWT
jgi:hypothetical protein